MGICVVLYDVASVNRDNLNTGGVLDVYRDIQRNILGRDLELVVSHDIEVKVIYG